jgi:hypothetical protein
MEFPVGRTTFRVKLLYRSYTHLGRFDPNNGKYRKVDMSDYIVVDCRGPKIGNGVQPSASRCTLYFDQNFQRCLCQVRNEAPITIDLAN